MRNLLSVVGLVAVAVAFAACGEKSRNPVIDGGSGGTGMKPTVVAGKSGNGEGGAEAEVVDPLAPIVTITAPKEVTDPNQDDVLVGTEVEVVCTATQSPAKNSEKVDGTSVKLELLDAEGNLVGEAKPGNPTDNDDEYSNTFNLVPVTSGAVSFRCTAKDLGGEHVGEDELESLVDKGPLITFIAPEEDGGFHPLAEVLAVDFTVEPAPLGDDDDGAAIETVALAAGGVDIDISDAEIGPGSYHVELKLTDGALFTPPPNGPFPLAVTATNRRSPEPVTAEARRDISVDGDGPVINITAPGDKQVVGGDVFLSFDVNDTVSGVDPGSVVVTLNDDVFKYPDGDWNRAGNTFTLKFNSRTVEKAEVQIAVEVSATDNVGNVSEGDAAVLYIDNVAPWVDMDPPNVRALNKQGECSASFDPLGDKAANDLDVLEPGGTFRAVVYETTNTLPNIVGYLAGTKKDSVTLYIRHGADGPLLEDTTGDGICDDIIERDEAAFLKLKPVAAQGAPSWAKDDDTQPTSSALGCTTRDNAPAQMLACDTIPQMSYVINHDTAANEAVVWGFDVGIGTCTGGGWDVRTKLQAEGWACVTTRVEDNAGNHAVSPPLRVCLNDPNVAGVAPCDEAQAPTCLKGCTAPPHWEKGAVTLD